MGLDAVELVIRFEDAFGISIPDEVAASLTTPREVTDYIVTQVAVGDENTCLSQEAFYFLRRGFSRRLQIPRSVFRPEVSLQTLIPKQNRKLVWANLKAELGEAALPDLARPLWLFSLLATITLFIGSYAFYATPKLPLQLNAWAALGITILCGFLLSFVSRPLKTNFRRRLKTIDGLVQHLLLYSPHTFKRDKRTWTRTQIAETVRAIIVDEIEVTDFTEDSHFINDMHID
jgi:acyl carrier protein